MSGYRQAAVALHDLGEEDRGWILSALPGEDRAMLEAYLEELKNLGFAGAPLHASATRTARADPPSADGDPAWSCVRQASPQRIAAILGSEPPSLAARLIAIEAWPWQNAVRALLDPALRERVERACAVSHPDAPALRAFVVQAIAARLDQEAPARAAFPVRQEGSVAARAARRLRSAIHRLGGPWKR